MRTESRCLVPFNSFSEYAPEPNPATGKKDVAWFALGDDRPLTSFAGIWTEYAGDRGTKAKPVPGPHLVYGFLTTEPNAVAAPIHPKAMPVGAAFASRAISDLTCPNGHRLRIAPERKVAVTRSSRTDQW
ncbi:putative SOS response-associated peptidase YedK [Bradyrhizobium sp. USDA 3256]